MTQQQLADAVGVTARTIQRWESGDKIPELDPMRFWRLCDALRCTAEDLARDFYPEAFSDDAQKNSPAQG